MDSTELRIAAVVPCHNEEAAVAKVVTDLKAAVPGIVVYVYDNLSTDRTAERAREAGAIVRFRTPRARAMSCAGPSPISRPTSI